MDSDAAHMRRAIRLGHRALGATAENPPVGCVIAAGSVILGVGWTQPGGRPHAETQAIAMAGAAARGATAYVTLEPCAHHGRTPPCADALVDAGISRAVIACTDPDPRVAGRGIAKLRAAGIAVSLGQGAADAARDLAGFFTRILKDRPQVTLKLAVSADGKLAARPGERTAITGSEANARVHLMRAQADAILIGSSTLSVDDPALTCRLPGLETRSPRRFVASRSGAIPANARIQPASLLDTSGGLHHALARLAADGINRLLLEGGARLAEAFLADGLVDEVVIIRSGTDLGSAGLAAPLDAVHSRFRITGLEWLGPDRLTRYEPRG